MIHKKKTLFHHTKKLQTNIKKNNRHSVIKYQYHEQKAGKSRPEQFNQVSESWPWKWHSVWTLFPSELLFNKLRMQRTNISPRIIACIHLAILNMHVWVSQVRCFYHVNTWDLNVSPLSSQVCEECLTPISLKWFIFVTSVRQTWVGLDTSFILSFCPFKMEVSRSASVQGDDTNLKRTVCLEINNTHCCSCNVVPFILSFLNDVF